jgi:hypothetical protein
VYTKINIFTLNRSRRGTGSAGKPFPHRREATWRGSTPTPVSSPGQYTDKKENQIFLICREIQSGAVAKSYMTNGLLIYGEYFRIS